MYKGKHTAGRTVRRRTKRRLSSITLIALILALFTVGGTVAFLTTSTAPMENTFTPAKTEIKVDEDFDKETKKNVTVTNGSTYPVYVRATYVAYWVSDSDSSVLAEVPTLTGSGINTANWTYRSADGYWYYNEILAAGAKTANFIQEFSAADKAGYHLVIDVIAESVQAEPAQAVIDVWGFTPTTSGN